MYKLILINNILFLYFYINNIFPHSKGIADTITVSIFGALDLTTMFRELDNNNNNNNDIFGISIVTWLFILTIQQELCYYI